MPDVNCVCITDQKDKYELEVVECVKCGFHLGIDASFLRSNSVQVPCPSCGQMLIIAQEE